MDIQAFPVRGDRQPLWRTAGFKADDLGSIEDIDHRHMPAPFERRKNQVPGAVEQGRATDPRIVMIDPICLIRRSIKQIDPRGDATQGVVMDQIIAIPPHPTLDIILLRRQPRIAAIWGNRGGPR